MSFPTMRKTLEEAGYSFAYAKECKCGAKIELWNTPKGNFMPLDFRTNEHGIEVCEPHFASPCPFKAEYSRKLQAKEAAKKATNENPANESAGPMTPDAACTCTENAALPYGGHAPGCPNAIPF